MKNKFGTTEDMIIQSVEENGIVYQLAVDAAGLYLTTKNRVSSLLADLNRYTRSRKETEARLSALGMNPAELFEQNKHLIRTDSGEAVKKVNPLKASKRSRG